jgi:hypothetical protein
VRFESLVDSTAEHMAQTDEENLSTDSRLERTKAQQREKLDRPNSGAGGCCGAAAAGGYNGPLDRSTRDVVSLIFDAEMMIDALKELGIDTAKMPLGKLSKATISKASSALSELQKLFEADPDAVLNDRANVDSLSNRFYCPSTTSSILKCFEFFHADC